VATKTILSTTETRATFAVSGDFVPGSVDETVTTAECVILQIDYDNNVGDIEIYRVTEPNLTPVFTFSGAGVGAITNTGQLGLSAEPTKDLRVFIEDGTVTITLKKVSGFTQL
jgi:hypothetical protein